MSSDFKSSNKGLVSGNNANCLGVSGLIFTAFPDDPEAGELLKPHYPLTYEKLKTFAFDENSTLRYALELIEDNKYIGT